MYTIATFIPEEITDSKAFISAYTSQGLISIVCKHHSLILNSEDELLTTASVTAKLSSFLKSNTAEHSGLYGTGGNADDQSK